MSPETYQDILKNWNQKVGLPKPDFSKRRRRESLNELHSYSTPILPNILDANNLKTIVCPTFTQRYNLRPGCNASYCVNS